MEVGEIEVNTRYMIKQSSFIWLIILTLLGGCNNSSKLKRSNKPSSETIRESPVNEISPVLTDTLKLNKDFFLVRYTQNDSLVLCHDFAHGGLDHNVNIEASDSILHVSVNGKVFRERFSHCTVQDYKGYGISPEEGLQYEINSGVLSLNSSIGRFILYNNTWVCDTIPTSKGVKINRITISPEHLVFGSNFATVFKVIDIDKDMRFLESSYIKVRNHKLISETENVTFENIFIEYKVKEETKSTSDFEYEGFMLVN